MANESQFPRKLQGMYVKYGAETTDSSEIFRCWPDSSVTLLEVSATQLTETTIQFYRAHPTQLQLPVSTTNLPEIRVYLQSKGYTQVELKGDTVTAKTHRTDTIFSLSDTNILRHYKGKYFLNSYQSFGWETEIMELKKNMLWVANLYLSEEDVVNVGQITTVDTLVTADTTQKYLMAPTRRELKKTWNEMMELKGIYTRLSFEK